MNKVVGRLAPSPTGAQHLGNARTYLLAWLSARSQGGTVVLRIEDIDSPRIKPWATTQAIEDLTWLGLDWDEGPDCGGPNEPYIQTERTKGYADALDRLIECERVFPCVCSRSDVAEAASAPHVGSEGPIYPGTCRNWKSGQPLPNLRQWCWRFRASDMELNIFDRVAGEVSMNPAKELGDFPISRKPNRRSENIATENNGLSEENIAYQLAVVVDDAAMGITEVVRGADLLPSAIRQRDLSQVLGLTKMQYAHVPLVVGTDGRRLAKRHGDTRLSWYREHGVGPEQIVGWGAFSAGLIDQPRSLTARELIERFDWGRVSKETVVLDRATTLRQFGFG